MLAEPPSQDKEALRTDSDLSTSDALAEKPSRFSKLLPYFIPVALYQIFAGFLFSFAFPSLFNICLSFIGFTSLLLLVLALYWFQTKEYDVADNLPASTTETQNRSVLIIMLALAFLKLSTTPLVLSNISFQKEYMVNYRDALHADWSPQSHLAEIYEYMITGYAWADIVLLLYSLPLVLTIFRSAKRTGKIYTSFNFIFNTIMFGLALTLVFKILAIRNLEADSRSLSSDLNRLLVIAGLCAGLSLSVWIVNARKWRVGFFTLSIVMILLSMTLAYQSSSISSYANGVYDSYSDTRDLKDWRTGMMSVSKENIEAYGCPAKYITSTPSNPCEKSLITRPTEIPNADNSLQYCLNKNCAGLLGQYYASQYFDISNWGLTAAVNMSILSFSLLYYSLKRREQVSQKKITRYYKWLILLGAVGLACYFTDFSTGISKPVEEIPQVEAMSAFDADTLLETTEAYSLRSFRPDSPGYLNTSGAPIGGLPVIAPPFGNLIVRDVSAFIGVYSPVIFAEVFEAFGATGTNSTAAAANSTTNSTLNVDPNVTAMVTDMLANQTYNYIILGYNQSSNQIEVIDQGKAGNTSDTLANLTDSKPKVAILNLAGSTNNNFAIIVYVPDSAAQDEKDIYTNFIIPQASALTNNLSIPVLVTNNSQDLQLSNVVKYSFIWPRPGAPTQIVPNQIPALIREGLLKTSQKNISSVVFRLKGHYIDTDVEKSVNEVVVGREYRYVLLGWDPSNLLKVVKRAPKNASYDELLTDLTAGKSNLALIDFQFSADKDVPVLISWSPELIYTQQWQTEVYELILNEVSNLNIPYMETNDITALSQVNLTDFLQSFWSTQVETFSKYNSTDLMLIFPNTGGQTGPESLFGPLYESSNTTGGQSLLTDMLLLRTYRYVLFNEVQQDNQTKLIFNKTAPKEASLSNFLTDVKGNGNQLALIYLDFLNVDKIVCLAITDQASLEKNYLNYAKIAAAAEVYDIPMAYVTSVDNIDIEQLTLFTFAPEILHILDELKIDPAIQDYWKQFSAGTKNGYITFIMQDTYSQVKLQKAVEGSNVTYQNFTSELTDNQALYAILNIANTTQTAASGSNSTNSTGPYLVTWIPQNVDVPSKILYKQAEVLLFALLPGSEDQQKNIQSTAISSLLY